MADIFGNVLGLVGKGADYLLGTQDRRRADHDANQQRAAEQALQREFAQNGIRWKVEDAKAAGIHPALALGAQVSSYSPIAVGDSRSPSTDFGSMGQDISRAVHATQTSGERVDAYTQKLRQLQLTKGDLENQLLASQIARIRQGSGPPLPSGDPKKDSAPDLKLVDPHMMGGQTYMHQGGSSQASHIEDQYGEVADWVGGMNWARDVAVPYLFPGLIESLRRGQLRKTGSRFVSKRYRD